jgi:UDP-glucose 4-epimerase
MVVGVTGSSGFIGSYLTRYLLKQRIGPLRTLIRNKSRIVENTGEMVIQGDLMSRADCRRFADGLQVIYYLAHNNTPTNSDLDPSNDALLNIVPLLNLLQTVRELETRPHIVYFSSGGAIYGPNPAHVPFREPDACFPTSSYGIQKLTAEHYLRTAADKGYLTAIALRLGNAYGTLLPQHRMQGFIGVAVKNVLEDRPVYLFGNTLNVRDYIHLEDICRMAVRASRPRQPFMVVNVGSGTGVSVIDILRLIEEFHGSPVEIQEDSSYGQWLTDWVVLNVERAAQEFGWKAEVDLHCGIRQMIGDWRAMLETQDHSA